MSLQKGSVVRRVAKKVFLDKIDSSFSFSSDQLDSNIKKRALSDWQSSLSLSLSFLFPSLCIRDSFISAKSEKYLKIKVDFDHFCFFKCQVFLKSLIIFVRVVSYVVMLLS
jgi:hypothetical protein